MRFIYAEVSFFDMWWSAQSARTKAIVKECFYEMFRVQSTFAYSLLKSGVFEIVTGAWVMTDEANAHYYNMIDQMIEGHQWLLKELGKLMRS